MVVDVVVRCLVGLVVVQLSHHVAVVEYTVEAMGTAVAKRQAQGTGVQEEDEVVQVLGQGVRLVVLGTGRLCGSLRKHPKPEAVGSATMTSTW